MQAHGRGKESCRAARNQLPMTEHEASRTLVKSTPELWAECSDAASLAKHLGAFGEIRITKLEPETAVAWEGEAIRGTVTLEPSGWGTRVIITAIPQAGGDPVQEAPAAEPIPEVPERPVAAPPPERPVAGPPPPVAETAGDAPPETLLPEMSLPEPALPEVQPESVQPEAPQPAQEREAPEPDKSAAAPRPGFWRRLFGGKQRATSPVAEQPEPVAEPESVAVHRAFHQPEASDDAEKPGSVEPLAQPERPEPEAPSSDPAAAALLEALDSLGRAHHRPYSRGEGAGPDPRGPRPPAARRRRAATPRSLRACIT
jgi:hypothetical protein